MLQLQKSVECHPLSTLRMIKLEKWRAVNHSRSHGNQITAWKELFSSGRVTDCWGQYPGTGEEEKKSRFNWLTLSVGVHDHHQSSVPVIVSSPEYRSFSAHRWRINTITNRPWMFWARSHCTFHLMHPGFNNREGISQLHSSESVSGPAKSLQIITWKLS